MRRFFARLIFWMLFVISLYLGACEGLRFLLLRAINRNTDSHHCRIYFNYLWLRPDLKVELRRVGFSSDLSQHLWTADRAVLRFFWPALALKEVSFDSIDLYDARFSFLLSRFYKEWRDKRDAPDIVRDDNKWVLKELDSRWDVRIDEFVVHNGRVEFYEDRNKQDKVDLKSTMTLKDVNLLARNFYYPFRAGPFSYRLAADFVQKGDDAGVTVLGATVLANYDTKAELNVSGLDLKAVSPLLSAELNRSIKNGRADIKTEIMTKDRTLSFPANVHLDGFTIEPDATVFNIPYKMLTSFLAHTQSRMDIVVDVSGTIGDPVFKLRDRFNNTLRYGIESTLKGILNIPVNIVSSGANAIGKVVKPKSKEKKKKAEGEEAAVSRTVARDDGDIDS